MIISSMTKLVKLGKNLKSHLSRFLMQLATLSPWLARTEVTYYIRETHRQYPEEKTNKMSGY